MPNANCPCHIQPNLSIFLRIILTGSIFSLIPNDNYISAKSNPYLRILSFAILLNMPQQIHFRPSLYVLYLPQLLPASKSIHLSIVLNIFSRSFFADSSIHTRLFLSLPLRLLSFDFSLFVFLAHIRQYVIPEHGIFLTAHTTQFLSDNAIHHFIGMICDLPTKPKNYNPFSFPIVPFCLQISNAPKQVSCLSEHS